MPVPIVLPAEYGYPMAAVVSTFWVTLYQTINVGRARTAAKIEYPQLYAEKDEAVKSQDARIFNCSQRAHQNTLEWLPQVITSTLIVGLKYPRFAAVACGAWSLARVLYTVGYSSGDPKKRDFLGSLVLNGVTLWGFVVGASSYTVYQFIAA